MTIPYEECGDGRVAVLWEGMEEGTQPGAGLLETGSSGEVSGKEGPEDE